jgi:hypothetical protein
METTWIVASTVPKATKPVIALFDASDDTVEMVRRMLDASGLGCLVECAGAAPPKPTAIPEHQAASSTSNSILIRYDGSESAIGDPGSGGHRMMNRRGWMRAG